MYFANLYLFIYSLFVGLNDAIQTSTSIDTQKASTDFLSAQLSSIPSVNSIDLTSINQGTNNILSSSSAIIETIVPNIQNAFVAIGNANIRLASELGDAGNILGGNILNLGMATGDVANKIIVRFEVWNLLFFYFEITRHTICIITCIRFYSFSFIVL